jgi:3-hydroxymyristoyl/3-hydroxydecanoyl-(acyl carrier protein) dehydratase
MDDHFRAFSFVDRIHPGSSGLQIRGSYLVPAGLTEFSSSLVAEAVGQLAAWAAMVAVDFRARPVAGIASRVQMNAAPRPGQTLELAANLESVDDEAVGYCGSASVDGKVILRLEHCVGPMMPVADFDDPQLLRARHALLCGAGATPGAFDGVPTMALTRTTGENGHMARATLEVPAAAPLFADHFPRKPVFPGSLLMCHQLQLAAAFAKEIPPPNGATGSTWGLHEIADMKLRSFIPPGSQIELEVKLLGRTERTAELALEGRREGRLVGAARVLLATEAHS